MLLFYPMIKNFKNFQVETDAVNEEFESHVDALDTILNFFSQLKDKSDSVGHLDSNEVECIEACLDIVSNFDVEEDSDGPIQDDIVELERGPNDEPSSDDENQKGGLPRRYY